MLGLCKIISGGQSGADRAGIDWAIANGIDYGGWIPRGRISEDGGVPTSYTKLVEHSSPKYPPRTQANVVNSDATVIFSIGKLGRGSLLTLDLAETFNKPHRTFVLLDEDSDARAATALFDFLSLRRPTILNVAGGRESKHPGLYRRVCSIFDAVKRQSLHQT